MGSYGFDIATLDVPARIEGVVQVVFQSQSFAEQRLQVMPGNAMLQDALAPSVSRNEKLEIIGGRTKT